MKIEYLLFNVIIFLGPLILSFVPVIFIKRLTTKEVLYSIPIPAILFLVWDFIVTGYFWNFNNAYILGFKIGHIPIEEMLFFITVPYSCLFLWKNWKVLNKKDVTIPSQKSLLVILIVLFAIFYKLPYTAIVLAVLGLIITIDLMLKTALFNSKRFLCFLGIILLLTFITNGYLTARPVVTYNENVKTNIQVASIPIEDFFYGIALIAFVVILYEHNKKQF